MIRLSRRLEQAAYGTADRIVVLSRAFIDNLRSKEVPAEKIELIYDPATRVPGALAQPGCDDRALRILSMGNIGHSQGLTSLVRAFETYPDLDATFVITGTGVAADEARAEIRTGRIEMLGVVDDDLLERELRDADIALVSQRYEGSEFNIPSKLMNFMAYGLPVLGVVNPAGEVARIVRESEAGWIVDSSDADAFPRELARLSTVRDEIRARGTSARSYAEHHFEQHAFAQRFERLLEQVAAQG